RMPKGLIWIVEHEAQLDIERVLIQACAPERAAQLLPGALLGCERQRRFPRLELPEACVLVNETTLEAERPLVETERHLDVGNVEDDPPESGRLRHGHALHAWAMSAASRPRPQLTGQCPHRDVPADHMRLIMA